MCQTLTSSGSRDPTIQVNVIKLVGVASRMMAADEQQNKHKTRVVLSVSIAQYNETCDHHWYAIHSCLLAH